MFLDMVSSLFQEGRNEMLLFNNILNIFYLRLYGVGYKVKDYSDNEREETRSSLFHKLSLKVL